MKTKVNILFALLALVLGYEVFIHATSPARSGKTAYVNTIELYNSFDYKNELEGQLTEIQQARQAVLDSMELDLQAMAVQLQSEADPSESSVRDFQLLRNELLQRQQGFASDNEKLAAQFTEQIWNQLNQYVQDYGTDQGFEYIFGADGQGKLMYADQAREVTNELKTYVNDRFAGESRK